MLREYSQLPGCAKTEKATSSARLCLLASLGLGIVGLPRHGAENPRGAGLGLPPRAQGAPSAPSPGPGRGRALRACRELRRGPGPVWRPRGCGNGRVGAARGKPGGGWSRARGSPGRGIAPERRHRWAPKRGAGCGEGAGRGDRPFFGARLASGRREGSL